MKRSVMNMIRVMESTLKRKTPLPRPRLLPFFLVSSRKTLQWWLKSWPCSSGVLAETHGTGGNCQIRDWERELNGIEET